MKNFFTRTQYLRIRRLKIPTEQEFAKNQTEILINDDNDDSNKSNNNSLVSSR